MDLSTPSTSNGMNICKLCNERCCKYTCPRCGIGYCNADCYKSEGHIECSESFYKQCIEEELKSQECDPTARNKMVEILKRLQDEELKDNILDNINEDEIDEGESHLDSDDDENIPDLEERLKNINLDNADEVWSALTDSERQEFKALIKNGEAEKLLPVWVPWWTQHGKKKLVQDLDEVTDYTKECPTLIEVPIFTEVQKASPNIYFNLINVIYAYAYTALYYNGDYLNCAEEATLVFLDICGNIKMNKVYDSENSAIESVIESVVNNDVLPNDEQTLLTFKEAGASIMQGPGELNKSLYISAALSEIHRLLIAAKEEISQQKDKDRNKEFSKQFGNKINQNNKHLPKKTLFLYSKKLEYYLSWVKRYNVKT